MSGYLPTFLRRTARSLARRRDKREHGLHSAELPRRRLFLTFFSRLTVYVLPLGAKPSKAVKMSHVFVELHVSSHFHGANNTRQLRENPIFVSSPLLS